MSVGEIDLNRDDLIELLDTRFEAINTRFDDNRHMLDLRHREILDKIESIDISMNRAHSRISESDGIISRLEHRIKEIGDNYHRMSSNLTVIIRDQIQMLTGVDIDKHDLRDEAKPITRMDLRYVFMLIVGTVIATVAVIKYFAH